MGKVYSLANQKGGVGKTVSSYALGGALSRAGKTVLLIDADPQYSLSLSAGCMIDDKMYNGMSTCSLFRNNIDPLDCCFSVDTIQVETPTLFIVPSSQELAITAKKLYSYKAGIEIFRKNVNKLREYFDYIFIDCPPSLDELLTSSLVASDGVIIPVKPEKLSYAGLQLIIPTIEAIKNAPDNQPHNRDLEITGIIVTMLRRQVAEHREYLNKLTEEYHVIGAIPLSTTVTKGLEVGLPVVIAHPTSSAAREYTRIALTL